jgi:integrase
LLQSEANGGLRGGEERGVHFIQVMKWLGHSSYVLTLTTYADYIPEQETENPLPEPVAAPLKPNIVKLRAHR